MHVLSPSVGSSVGGRCGRVGGSTRVAAAREAEGCAADLRRRKRHNFFGEAKAAFGGKGAQAGSCSRPQLTRTRPKEGARIVLDGMQLTQGWCCAQV